MKCAHMLKTDLAKIRIYIIWDDRLKPGSIQGTRVLSSLGEWNNISPTNKKNFHKMIRPFRDDFKYCTTVILLQLIDEGFITGNPIIISCVHHNKGTSASLKQFSDQGTLTPLATARKPSSMAFKRLESWGFFWLESDQSK